MFNRIINSLEEAIIAILLASMTLLVFTEVVLRFGFGKGMMWAQELTTDNICLDGLVWSFLRYQSRFSHRCGCSS